MYIDVPRRLVFFDKRDNIRPTRLSQYHPDSGAVSYPPGPQADDSISDISADGRRMALQGIDWLIVRGASRSRLSFIQDGAPLQATDRFLSYWARFDPTARYALVSVFNGKKRPVIIDLDSGECSDPIARDVDARFGSIDPVQGKLWAPDERASNSVLVVDCASGQISKVLLPLTAKVKNLRFSRDGQYLFVVGENHRLLCCDRDGAVRWARDMGEVGQTGAGQIFFNESGSHLCLPLSSTQRSDWGEDIIIATESGQVENAVVRQKGPPARLAADWFGDRLLTHRLEVVDFFTGAVIDTIHL